MKRPFIWMGILSLLIYMPAVRAQSGAGQGGAKRYKAWYVSGKGSDNNPGTSLSRALRNLQTAADKVQPGDTVWVANGVYTNSQPAANVVNLSVSGNANAWISWKALRGHTPEIKPNGWAGINITASYIMIDGINVTGANDSIILIKALEQAKQATPDPFYNTNGITIEGRRNDTAHKPHHIVIRNSTISKCAGGGIAVMEADYITVEDCNVFENAWYMRYGGSGISTLNNWAYDDLPGYHIIIQRNKVWNNKTMVPWEHIGKLSDGNGIILDVTDQEVGATNPNADSAVSTPTANLNTKPKRPEWKGRALIANNLSVYNGGSGIHTFRTKHVDIINNTTYWNGQVVGYQELFPNRSEDVVILNNIIVPKPGGKVTSNNRNVNIHWDYNVYPTAQNVFIGEHDLVTDPKFIKAMINVSLADFRLAVGSAALNSGSKELAQPLDVLKKKRPQGRGIDRGCYEQL